MAETYVPSDGGGFPVRDLPDTTVQVKRTKDGPIVHDLQGRDRAKNASHEAAVDAVEESLHRVGLPSTPVVDDEADLLTRTAQARARAVDLRDRRDAAAVALKARQHLFEEADREYRQLADEARKQLTREADL